MAIFVLPVPVENNLVRPNQKNTTFSYIEAVRIILLKLQDIKHELKKHYVRKGKMFLVFTKT
jgi:hypothetical protein